MHDKRSKPAVQKGSCLQIKHVKASTDRWERGTRSSKPSTADDEEPWFHGRRSAPLGTLSVRGRTTET